MPRKKLTEVDLEEGVVSSVRREGAQARLTGALERALPKAFIRIIPGMGHKWRVMIIHEAFDDLTGQQKHLKFLKALMPAIRRGEITQGDFDLIQIAELYSPQEFF